MNSDVNSSTSKLSFMGWYPLLEGSELNPLSALCVTAPGSAAAWEAAIQRWGVKTLRHPLNHFGMLHFGCFMPEIGPEKMEL